MTRAPPSITTVLATLPFEKAVGGSPSHSGPAAIWIGPDEVEECFALAAAAPTVRLRLIATTTVARPHAARRFVLIVLIYALHSQIVDFTGRVSHSRLNSLMAARRARRDRRREGCD
jgi:hypothetical protein